MRTPTWAPPQRNTQPYLHARNKPSNNSHPQVDWGLQSLPGLHGKCGKSMGKGKRHKDVLINYVSYCHIMALSGDCNHEAKDMLLTCRVQRPSPGCGCWRAWCDWRWSRLYSGPLRCCPRSGTEEITALIVKCASCEHQAVFEVHRWPCDYTWTNGSLNRSLCRQRQHFLLCMLMNGKPNLSGLDWQIDNEKKNSHDAQFLWNSYPDDPWIHCSKQGALTQHRLLHFVHAVQQPAELHRTEVGADGKACLVLERVKTKRIADFTPKRSLKPKS